MTTLKLYGYFFGVVPTWSMCSTKTADETELILLPPEAVICHDRDGVQCGNKFYTARNIHMLAKCSLRGFRLLSHQPCLESPSYASLICDSVHHDVLKTWFLLGRYDQADAALTTLAPAVIG